MKVLKTICSNVYNYIKVVLIIVITMIIIATAIMIESCWPPKISVSIMVIIIYMYLLRNIQERRCGIPFFKL